MKHFRRVAAAAVAASALVLATGCAADSAAPADQTPASDKLAELVTAAQSEGELTFYGDANETSLQSWTQGFTEKYGITVNILRLPGSELFQRFSQEMSADQHQADVFSVADRVSMQTAVDNGWIAEYTPENAGLYPADQSEAGYFYPVQNGYFQTVAYNPTLLSADEIKMIKKDPIKAAGDPAFKGRVGVNMPQSSQQAAAFYYRYAEGDAADEYGWDALQAIADNKPLFYSSATLIQNLIAGEYAVAVALTDSLAAPQALQGAPVEFVYPKDTTGGYFAVGSVADAPHPNASKLFMEWATTPEANAAYTKITQTVPANSEVPDEREITGLDWYKAPDVANVWFDFTSDSDFLKASSADGDFLSHWNEVFGYSG
ncbi:ABC transporter substrate-binding protein [Microbacterium sp. B2969]|uniref:ABC transporter substrate-binding protein n=1 Tax=Microbacterium alkaliflavum TaxID=3248839 RepID=A0ABW7Q402_9MICO